MKKTFAIFISLFLTIISLVGCIEKEISGECQGIFYINDSGEPKGGWEYTQPYYANLTINNGIGKLNIEIVPGGMGNRLTKHNFLVILKNYSEDEMVLLIDGKEVILEWVEHDDLWNKWHNHYIASFGIYMDENDALGKIKPDFFPGVRETYYVELRLPEIN